jgi:hypothetical protein
MFSVSQPTLDVSNVRIRTRHTPIYLQSQQGGSQRRSELLFGSGVLQRTSAAAKSYYSAIALLDLPTFDTPVCRARFIKGKIRAGWVVISTPE